MLQKTDKAKSYRLASGKLLPDLGARKVRVELKDGSLRYVNPRVSYTHRALVAVSEMNDKGHDAIFPRSERNIEACAYPEGSGTKLELERVKRSVRVATRACSKQPEYVERRHFLL